MSASRIIIVTGTDRGFVALTQDMYASLRRLKFKHAFDLGLIDLGLSTEEKAGFQAHGVNVQPVQSDIAYPMRDVWEGQKPSIRVLTARPFLRRYFPGYDVYVWIDADVWAQTPEAIDTMISEAARSPALCIAAELDRCYGAYFTSIEVWQHFARWYEACYGKDVAATMTFKPMLNAGVFAMNKASPIWDAWAELYINFLQTVTTGINPANFMADQLALNILLYMKGMPCVVLPASYNWLAFLHAMPKFDEVSGVYVEPFPPHRPISQFHLAGKDKFLPRKIQTIGGKEIMHVLTFTEAIKVKNVTA